MPPIRLFASDRDTRSVAVDDRDLSRPDRRSRVIAAANAAARWGRARRATWTEPAPTRPHVEIAVRDVEVPLDATRTRRPSAAHWLRRVAAAAALVVAGIAGRAYGPGATASLGAAVTHFRTSPAVARASDQTAAVPRRTTGRLIVTAGADGARVLVDGTVRGVAPLTLDDVPVGPHVVVLESADGSVRRSVRVTADEPAQISESIFAGWVTVFSPFEVTVAEGGRALGLDDHYRVLLPAGPHNLRIENRELGFDQVRRVDVQPGAGTQLSVGSPRSTLTVTASAPADVVIDGVEVGRTPLVDLPVDIGTREVVLRDAAGERRFTVVATVKPAALHVDPSRPEG